MTKYINIPNYLKPRQVSGTNIDQKITILGLLTLLQHEFDKIEYFDNIVFKQSLKASAKAFKSQIQASLNAYYNKDKPAEVIDMEMNTIIDLCNVIEKNISISYQLAEKEKSEAQAFLDEYSQLLKKYNLSAEQLTA